MEWLSDPAVWMGFATLLILEIVLGIDNIVFISILASKLPVEQQAKARRTGLMIALVSRIGFLLAIGLVMKLTAPLFTVFGISFSGKELILLLGGLFLIAKATNEIHNKLEGQEGHGDVKVVPSFGAIMAQVFILDVVFSIDSVITAVGMVKQVEVMVAAVVIAVMVMLVAAESIARFVEKHPTVKMLALAFLVLIGVNLIAEGFGQKIPKGYTYFAMAFSVFVEFLNIKVRSKSSNPVKLHAPYRQ